MPWQSSRVPAEPVGVGTHCTSPAPGTASALLESVVTGLHYRTTSGRVPRLMSPSGPSTRSPSTSAPPRARNPVTAPRDLIRLLRPTLSRAPGGSQIPTKQRDTGSFTVVFESLFEYNMIMSSGVMVSVAPVARALAAAREAMTELITVARDGGLDHHDEHELMELLSQSTALTNQLRAFDAELVAACCDRGVAEKACRRSMGKVLEQVCLISGPEAGRRVRAADATGPRTSPTGLPLPRLRPRVADAMAGGVINAEQTELICRTLTKIDTAGVHPDQVEIIETELVGCATRFAPRELKHICQRYLDIYDPDGTEPDEQRNWDSRFMRMRQTPSGAVVGEFRLTAATGAKLSAILEPLAKPRLDRTDQATTATADLRSREQRLHDALDEACSRLLRAGGLPASGGTPATVIVTIDLNDLLAHTGALPSDLVPDLNATPRGGPEREPSSTDPTITRSDAAAPGRVRRRPRRGVTSQGAVLTVPDLLDLAGEAEIYPVVLTNHGVLLEMGRSRRIANKHQTVALIARDGGCSFPGCDHPPEWCERHHIVPWQYDGPTELRNLTLLCGYHHRNFLNRGWQVRLNPDGLPEWLPPRWIDPDQRPRINNRIVARIHQSTLLAPTPEPPDPTAPPPSPE